MGKLIKENRRAFLAKGSLYAGSLLVLNRGVSEGARSAGGSRLSTGASPQVLEFLGRFSNLACYHGGGIAGNLNGSSHRFADLLVQVTDTATLSAALRKHPFKSVHVAGNTLSFEHGGTFYTIQTLLAGDFAREVNAVRAGERSIYAHGAITLGTASGSKVIDPYQANGVGGRSEISITRSDGYRSAPLPDQFAELIEGLRDLAYHQLAPTPEFEAFRDSVLEQTVGDIDSASQIVAALIKGISPLSRIVSRPSLRALVGSMVVSSSLRRSGRQEAEVTVERFGSLRLGHPAKYTDGSIWLATLLEPEIRQGTSDPHIWTLDRYASLQSRSDLALAKQIVDAKGGTATGGTRVTAGPTTLGKWAISNFGTSTEKTGPNDDFDSDGIPNLMEYALGLDPTVASSIGQPSTALQTVDGIDYLTMEYRKDLAKTDITYQVQTAADFREPSWSTRGVVDELVGTEGTIEQRVAKVPFDSPRRFLRLYVATR